MGPENLFGIDAREVALGPFLSFLRVGFATAVVLCLWIAQRKRVAWPLVVIAILGGGTTWLATNFPLARPYALAASTDRTANIQLVQVVAAGQPWWESAQPGQFTFEPFWGLFVAALSGFDPERVIPLYPFLPLIPIVLFPLVLYSSLRSAGLEDGERALATLTGSLLAASATEWAERFRDPWVMSFIFKPNHALGFVVAPVFLTCLSRADTRARRIAAGGLLGLLGWMCVFHMAFLWAALITYPFLRSKGSSFADDARRVVEVGATSAAIAGPYLWALLFRFPAGEPGPRFGNPLTEAPLLWPTLQSGPLALLAIVGIVAWLRRGSALARSWAALFGGAALFWVFLFFLGLSERARERDELVYWIRVFTAAAGGLGLTVLSRALGHRVGSPFSRLGASAQTVALASAVLPFSHPFFWDPSRMDLYFAESRRPLARLYRDLATLLPAHVPPDGVIACDPGFARYVSAFGARRVVLSENLNNLRADYERRERQLRSLALGDGPTACSAAAETGARFLLLTGPWSRRLGLRSEERISEPHWSWVGRAGDRDEWADLYEIRCPGDDALKRQ